MSDANFLTNFHHVAKIGATENSGVERLAATTTVRRIRAMARHDSVAMNRIVPTVMVFVPSMDGVSHGEREFTSDADLVVGVRPLDSVAGEMVNDALATNGCIEAQFSKVGL